MIFELSVTSFADTAITPCRGIAHRENFGMVVLILMKKK